MRTQVSDPQAASKLNAADATYHNDCRRTFMGQALLQLLKKKRWIQTYSRWCFYAVQRWKWSIYNSQEVFIIVKCISNETKKISLTEEWYAKHINKSRAKEYISDTLKALLKHIKNYLSNDKLPKILICDNCVSAVSKKATNLLFDLAILVRDKNE